MAHIRRKRNKWQVLIRKKFHKNIAKSFTLKEDAEKYARETEAKIDQGFLVSYEEAQKTRFGELLERYSPEPRSLKVGFNFLELSSPILYHQDFREYFQQALQIQTYL